MKYITIIVFFLMGCVSFGAHANDYVVRNVRVDVTADNASQARSKAFDQARMNAFNVLKDRLVSAPHKESIPDPTNSIVATMVDSFEINREKLSKNRYLASVNVSFNEGAVQSYLGRYINMALPDQYYGGQMSNDVFQNQPANHVGLPQQGKVDFNQQNQDIRPGNMNAVPYEIEVDLNGIRQWIGLQKSLQSIGSVQIKTLSAKKAVVVLSYVGDATKLQNDLGVFGRQLYSNPAGEAPYILMMRD